MQNLRKFMQKVEIERLILSLGFEKIIRSGKNKRSCEWNFKVSLKNEMIGIVINWDRVFFSYQTSCCWN